MGGGEIMTRSAKNLSIPQKILTVNAVILVLGTIVGTWITQLFGDAPGIAVAASLFGVGVVIAVLANYLVLRWVFVPLLALSRALTLIHKGRLDRPIAERSIDPNLRTVSDAVVEMLDRLESESRRYSALMFDAIEEERYRIGRELHDDTCQTLAAALISLELAEQGLATGASGALGRVEGSKDLIQHSLSQIRLLVSDLRPSMLDDLGLVPTLRWYVKTHLPGDELTVETDFEATAERLPAAVETALYRIAQESLGNVVKHSQATRVTVSLEAKPGYACLVVIDNGVGFVPDEAMFDADGRSGLGLLSIKERVELLDGTVTIDSAPGEGTRVHVVIPLGGETS
jgi:two-component system sensor histidine kinase UhpB